MKLSAPDGVKLNPGMSAIKLCLGGFLAIVIGGVLPGQAVYTGGREFYAAPNGRSQAAGTIADPWDLATALSSSTAVHPGDLIWLRGGTYGSGGATTFTAKLTGTRTRPIIIRQYPGERGVIDGSLVLEGGHTWVWGFEIMNSSAERRGSATLRPGGLSLHGRTGGNKAINMVIHDAGQPGIGLWDQGQDGEVYGCIVWGNGYYEITMGSGTPEKPWIRGDGLYSQNTVGEPVVADSIWFRNFTVGVKSYAEGGSVRGFRYQGNISFENPDRALFLATNPSQPNPVQDILVSDNYVYQTIKGSKTLHLGYKGVNGDAIVTGNYLVGADGGTTATFFVRLFQRLVAQDNVSVGVARGKGSIVQFQNTGNGQVVWDQNSYYGGWEKPFRYIAPDGSDSNQPFATWKSMTGLDANSTYSESLPTGLKVFVRPNKYEAGRGNIAIYNWDLKPSVPVDLSNVVPAGSTYEIRDAQNWFGEPVLKGTYNGGTVDIPMNLTTVAPLVGDVAHFDYKTHTAPRFGAFVVLSQLPAVPPAVAAGGIGNAAGLGSGTGIAPGSLISIYGQNLTAGRAEVASSTPWPFALAGTQVRIDGQLSPLYFASPTQINAQVPSDLSGGRDVEVRVVVGDQAGSPENVSVVETSPGIFAVLGDGARPGEALSIYGTGLGAVSPEVPTGYASLADPLSYTILQPQVIIGGQDARVIYSGLAPWLVGVNQVNAIIPDGVPPGRAEVLLRVGDRISNSKHVVVAAR